MKESKEDRRSYIGFISVAILCLVAAIVALAELIQGFVYFIEDGGLVWIVVVLIPLILLLLFAGNPEQ